MGRRELAGRSNTAWGLSLGWEKWREEGVLNMTPFEDIRNRNIGEKGVLGALRGISQCRE